jgi:hypothetical protein
MSTARATTDEAGNIHSLASFIGKPIPASDLFSGMSNGERVWVLSGSENDKITLNNIRYGLKGYFAVAALSLIENDGYRDYEPIRTYREKNKALFAIHCYERGTVTMINGGSSRYRTISDALFVNEIPKVEE